MRGHAMRFDPKCMAGPAPAAGHSQPAPAHAAAAPRGYVSGRDGLIMIDEISAAISRAENRRPETAETLTNLRDSP